MRKFKLENILDESEVYADLLNHYCIDTPTRDKKSAIKLLAKIIITDFETQNNNIDLGEHYTNQNDIDKCLYIERRSK